MRNAKWNENRGRPSTASSFIRIEKVLISTGKRYSCPSALWTTATYPEQRKTGLAGAPQLSSFSPRARTEGITTADSFHLTFLARLDKLDPRS